MQADSQADQAASSRPGDSIDPSRRRLGMTISMIGIVGFLPSIFLIVLAPDFRFVGVVLMFVFWIVWKIGRTILKVNTAL